VLEVAAVAGATGFIGALVGSFLNVVVHRLPRGESVVRPRSRCPQCGTELAGRDNVPILSWVTLGGKCRSCRTSIPARYPLVEALTATCFAGAAAVNGVDLDLIWELPFIAALVALAAIDLERHVVPNKIVLPAAVVGAVAAVALRLDSAPELAAAGGGALLLLLVVALIQPQGMGMGDVKLAGVLGLFLGLSVIPALLIAFLSGSLVGGVIMARHGVGARKRKLPFGPFLAFGGYVALLAGPQLIDLYQRLLLS
jgi:leader peptidase (prepilin peptidase)/N-methyltransferase